jgi:5-deoxy-D-glucuronate isomerase
VTIEPGGIDRGCRPLVVPHRYDSDYPSVMTGPQRHWACRDSPPHEWMLARTRA